MIYHPPKDGERIAILGGSFNPPHIGHAAICGWLLGKNQAERVWVIPCYEHPFGKELAPFDDRYRMCLFTFGQFGAKVEVSDIERRLGGVSFTIRTIEYLKEHFPRVRFSFVTGGDVNAERSKWHDFVKLEKLIPIIKIPRGEYSHIPNVSATEIRTRIESGKPISKMVDPAVAVFIATHGLYHAPKVVGESE
jgi:nicotinate-nucleotide adenylyltransferase